MKTSVASILILCIKISCSVVASQASDINQGSSDGVNSNHGKQKTQHLTVQRDARFRALKESYDADQGSSVRIIVEYKNNAGRRTTLGVADRVLHDFLADKHLVIEANLNGLEKLELDSNIESAEEDTIWKSEGILEQVIELDEIDRFIKNPDNARRHLADNEQIPYGITMIQADKVKYGRNKVTVCIVDTGVRVGHPDFDQDLLQGTNRVSDVNGVIVKWNNDTRGHGTHITGTINAKGSNDYGVRGIGAIPIYMTRGLNDDGRAYESDIRASLEQCERAGTKVITLSLSGPSMTVLMGNILDRLSKNALIIAASGNGGGRNQNFPASYDKVVSVGAVEKSEELWKGSNYGPWLELTAPGAGILSTGFTWKGNYSLSVYSGTSMAAPHVAGAAALLWSNYPDCTATQIRYALAYTAKDKNKTGCDDFYGYGIVQIKAAYDFLFAYPCRFAPWGKSSGDGTCSAIDVRASNVVFVPKPPIISPPLRGSPP